MWAAGSALLWLLYLLVFRATLQSDWLGSAEAAAINVAPVAALAVALRSVIRNEVMQRSTVVQGLLHGGLAIAFSTMWYATVLVLLALSRGMHGRGFDIEAFPPAAFAWQVFQGLILYSAVAALCYSLQHEIDGAATQTILPPASAASTLVRYLIRQGDSITPVEVSEIETITGAQDYSEVTTAKGKHLVRMTLGEFETRLDRDTFVRVHRSTIINLSRLLRTEPAGGGRLLAHMQSGEVVQVSRAGTQALRRFVV